MKYNDVQIVARRRCPVCADSTIPAHRAGCGTCKGAGFVDTELLHPGEPFFLVRGQDELAERLVALYAVLFCLGHGLPADQWPADLVAKMEQIRAWQEANPGLVKLPD